LFGSRFIILTMKPHDDIHFEEGVFGRGMEEFEYVEMPIHRQIFGAISFIAIVVLAIATSRLLFLNFKKGEFYENRALGNAHRETVVPASRGIIYDRFGEPLVKNEPIFSVSLATQDFLRKDIAGQQKLLGDLHEILDPTDSGEYIIDIIAKADIEKSPAILLDRGIDSEKAIALKGLNDASIQIRDDYRRAYIFGPAFAHILGYTGLGETDRSIEGKTGLEKYYDSLLKGRDGKFLEGRDVRGEKLYDRFEEQPEAGSGLTTTIDAELQKYFYARMKRGLDDLGRDAGVGIAMNPQTGETLALFSFPSYDDNIFTTPGKNDERRHLLNSPAKPLFSRAISGVYNPGSTIKPMMALAALNEGNITPQLSVYSDGVLEVANPFDASKPSKFLDWKAHGWVNLYSALARSSNIYFYVVGGGHRDYKDIKGLGIVKIQEYFKYFGFDKITGIDLPGESRGVLLGPADREAQGRIWRVGDTYNVSIGQGDMAVAPLQLINFIGAIGEGGHMKQPFLVKEIKNNDGKIIKSFTSKDILDFSDLGPYIKEVQIGLRAAVDTPDGTAKSLNDLGVSVSGKTGSAQILGNTKTNAFFVGYAPSENPEIAILVLVEDAREGSLNTIPIAKDVLGWYYKNRMVDG